MKKLVDLWFRYQACKLAGPAIAPRLAELVEGAGPVLWSTVVFYEEYLRHGAKGTQTEFGPKDPVELHVVKAEVSST